MNKALNTIAVDLTPVLPGGENGGAKIFTIELLSRLSEIFKSTKFILLTQSASHEELALLDRPNMRRLMVIGPMAKNAIRSPLKRLGSHWLPLFPDRWRHLAETAGYTLNKSIKRWNTSKSMLHDLSVDLLFCPFTAPTFFEYGIPMVSIIYDLQFLSYTAFFAVEDVAYRRQTFWEACRYANALSAISDFSRKNAIAYGNLDPSRIRTIYLHIPKCSKLSANKKTGILSRNGLSPKRYLVYPANFWKHKNHEMLLAAFGMACHEGLAPDIKLVCTGAPGKRQTWLMNAAQRMNLGGRILFPGYLPKEEFSTLMGRCGGVVFPSLYEGFGLPIIESMAAGVPVACGNTTSLPEVAGDAALLFDPRIPSQIAHVMISLTENEALRARLIQAGNQRALEFSDADFMAKQYWELFEYAVSKMI